MKKAWSNFFLYRFKAETVDIKTVSSGLQPIDSRRRKSLTYDHHLFMLDKIFQIMFVRVIHVALRLLILKYIRSVIDSSKIPAFSSASDIQYMPKLKLK